jgi:hypothetical protein
LRRRIAGATFAIPINFGEHGLVFSATIRADCASPAYCRCDTAAGLIRQIA